MNGPAPGLYRAAAIASGVSAVTTLMLIFLPRLYPPVTDLPGRMALVEADAYQLRAWTYLIHPFLTGFAALAVGLALRGAAPARALLGTAGFLLWSVVEAAQQALTLAMFDRWRRSWLAGDTAVRETMALRTALYDGLWDAAYLLLLIGFLIGCTAFAAAMIGRGGLTRAVGIFYVLAAALTLALLLVEAGGPSLPDPVTRWAYPAIQPLARLLIGLWLWRTARAGGTLNPFPAAR